MKKDQLDLFTWADNRPSAQVIDLVPIIVRNMPEVDPQYPEPAKLYRPEFERKRGAA
ncbi:hypothetical protein LXM94_01895 [Rhizobium sp. TRM95111]|uniref:hypothetical protein n=1 Tax=Rhizobium alarense TaxID=2846851 RepID=UPI001F1D1ADF|nr:hypothetical protein [Rhizobium alarense]MCF3638723.1 hypothetical protein [Rhizobium alarense]